MTAAFLQSELTNLIQEAKRKNHDVKDAAERSLRELKSVTVTSEAQLAGDLIRKPTFIDSFILACRSQNAKLASSGTTGLQRLVASAAVPRTRLPDLLAAFEEAVTQSVEVQLKILQTLPSLVQLYESDLTDDLWPKLLNLCAGLSGNKQPVVSNTAGATGQQLVLSIFDKAAAGPLNSQPTNGRQTPDTERGSLSSQVFEALCLSMTTSSSTTWRFHDFPLPLTLEIIEEILARHGAQVLDLDHALDVCATHLVPRILHFVEASTSWIVVTRAYRIGVTLLSLTLSQIPQSLCDYLLALLKTLEKSSSLRWKRVLALEAFRNVCTDFALLQNIYATYDHEPQRPKIVVKFVAALVRIAAEEPMLIGLGRQSTLPAAQNIDDNSDAVTDVDTIGSGSTFGAVRQGDAAAVGLSVDWSTMPTSCLEQPSRSAPPEIPTTYIYTLVLDCVAAISEGLSRFVVPLSTASRRRVRSSTIQAGGSDISVAAQPSSQHEANHQGRSQPTTSTEDPMGRSRRVELAALMIESCWPGILATCSTFLNASLDTHFYHILIRTTQKLTQVSGVLELDTPRDAFLTTLAKSSVPINASSILNAFYAHDTAQDLRGADRGVEVDNDPTKTTPRTSVDLSLQAISVRNLLCLRALLNLGIALGSSLSAAAWTIVMQPLQQIDALMFLRSNVMASRGALGHKSNDDGAALKNETTAVDTARRRLIEVSSTYPDAAFRIFVESIFTLIDDLVNDGPLDADSASSTRTPNTPGHRIKRSVSGQWTRADVLRVEVQFVLKILGRVISVNLERFKVSELVWKLIVERLLQLLQNRRLKPDLRLQVSNIVDAIVVESFKELNAHDTEGLVLVPVTCGLRALEAQIDATTTMPADGADIIATNSNIRHQLLLAMENVINSCGDSLGHGWEAVFRIMIRAVVEPDWGVEELADDAQAKVFILAFKITQTIVSDFVPSLSSTLVLQLLRLVALFAQQQVDLNMTLTATALIRSINTLFLDHPGDVCLLEHVHRGSSASQEESSSNLWSLSTREISRMTKDNRVDARNASLRMLFTIVTNAIPKMSSQTINDCVMTLFIPLISYYYDQNEESASWTASAEETIILITRLVSDHATLFLAGTGFTQTWHELIDALRIVLETHELNAMTTILSSSSNMLGALRAVQGSQPDERDRQILSMVWHNIWTPYNPADIQVSTASNLPAISAYLDLLHTMEAFNREAILSFDRPVEHVSRALSTALLSAVHDQYTFDDNKISEEQERVLHGLRTMSSLLNDNILELNNFILSLIQKSLAALTSAHSSDDRPFSSLPRNLKAPTRISFMTHCLEKLNESTNRSRARRLSAFVNVKQMLDTCVVGASTKYSRIVNNTSCPLWRTSTLLAAEVLEILGEQSRTFSDLVTDEMSSKSVEFVKTVLETPHLDARQGVIKISDSKLVEDERFDMDQFQRIHAASVPILSCSAVSRTHRTRYVVLLFDHSFATKPWRNDLTAGIADEPLANLMKLRRGSIREPILPLRREISREVLKALFDMARTSRTADRTTTNSDLASLAAPYILLRLAHSLKTFIVDQRLRHLKPPHKALRQDLAFVLELFTTLRTRASCFADTAQKLGYQNTAASKEDDTVHLRLLWGLYEIFNEAWIRAPRLELLAWQDGEEGRSIERSLRRWRERMTVGWGPRFEL